MRLLFGAVLLWLAGFEINQTEYRAACPKKSQPEPGYKVADQGAETELLQGQAADSVVCAIPETAPVI